MIDTDEPILKHMATFLRALPADIPEPAISVEEDGMVDFEWYQSPSRVVSVSLDHSGKLHWAMSHHRYGEQHGVAEVGATYPIIECIRWVVRISVGDWVCDRSSPRYEGIVVHRCNDLLTVRFADMDDDGPTWMPMHHYEVEYIDHRPEMLLLGISGPVLRGYEGNYVCVAEIDGKSKVIAFGDNVAGVEQSGMNLGKAFDTWQVNSYATKVGSWAPGT